MPVNRSYASLNKVDPKNLKIMLEQLKNKQKKYVNDLTNAEKKVVETEKKVVETKTQVVETEKKIRQSKKTVPTPKNNIEISTDPNKYNEQGKIKQSKKFSYNHLLPTGGKKHKKTKKTRKSKKVRKTKKNNWFF
jgi:hypothetical protein